MTAVTREKLSPLLPALALLCAAGALLFSHTCVCAESGVPKGPLAAAVGCGGAHALPALLGGAGLLMLLRALISMPGSRRGSPNTPGVDELTGLVDISSLAGRLVQLAAQGDLAGQCMVLLDIATFRRINTMYGSHFGDRMLRSVGRALGESYPLAARSSGDVFLLVTPCADCIVARLTEQLSSAVLRDMGEQYRQFAQFNFGVYDIGGGEFDFREAYDRARFALSAAKRLPRDNAAFFTPHLQQSFEEQKNIEIHMIGAIERGEFYMAVQPKFDVKTGRCCGGEALARWNSAQLGQLMPDRFIPIFERSGFIAELDLYMLESVFTLLEQMQGAGLPLLPISVNQSRVTLAVPNYLTRLAQLAQRYSVPLSYIEIEVTESAVAENLFAVASLLEQVRAMGFFIAMDDFGVGYSSLASLRAMAVDTLKIDKVFLHETETSERSRKIIAALLRMAGELGINTVCEGVETEAQVAFLREAGCSMGQGNYFSLPLGPQQFREMMSGN